jgi:hypothetical protein
MMEIVMVRCSDAKVRDVFYSAERFSFQFNDVIAQTKKHMWAPYTCTFDPPPNYHTRSQRTTTYYLLSIFARLFSNLNMSYHYLRGNSVGGIAYQKFPAKFWFPPPPLCRTSTDHSIIASLGLLVGIITTLSFDSTTLLAFTLYLLTSHHERSRLWSIHAQEGCWH